MRALALALIAGSVAAIASWAAMAQRADTERAFVLVEQARASTCFLAPSRPGPQSPPNMAIIAAAAEGDGAAMHLVAGALIAERSDPRTALRWLEQAATAGAASAAADAGAMYAAGRGITQNNEVAVQWWRFGAAHGDRRSMACLSAALLIGRGVGQDTVAAARWAVVREAGGGGPSLLTPTLADFERALPTATMDEARRLARTGAAVQADAQPPAPPASRGSAITAPVPMLPGLARSAVTLIQAPALPAANMAMTFGSGVVVGLPDVVITSNHVVDGCQSIEVHAGMARFAGVVRRGGLDVPDIALLTVPGLNRTPIPFATSVRPGTQVMLMGFPRTNLDPGRPSVAVGHVSGFGSGEAEWIMQFTAPTAGGNSGGPIIDRRGQVVGLAFAITDARHELRLGQNPAQNANFAVRPEQVARFLNDHSVLAAPASPAERDLSDVAESVERSVVKVVCMRPASPPPTLAPTPASIRAAR